MSLTRETAWEKLREWTQSEALLRHARGVEIVMRAAARRYGGEDADADVWGLAGLLHDADYEKWPEEHPSHVVAWLREEGEEDLAYAISAHYTRWGNPCRSMMDKALLACDELTGFIGACCLVRPGGIRSLAPKSVKKKLKDLRFAAKVDRSEIQAGIDLLEVDLSDHVAFIIDALRPHAEELGLEGAPPAAS